jgi:hypothetical protein
MAVLTTFSLIFATARENRSPPGAAAISSLYPPIELATLNGELAMIIA